MPSRKEYMDRWHKEHKAEDNRKSREYYYANREACLEYSKKYRLENPEKIRGHSRINAKKNRLKCLIHYSGDPPKCACCGETFVYFLQLHHKNGGGTKERQGGVSTSKFYRKLIRENFSTEMEVFCANCHQALYVYKRSVEECLAKST